MRAEVLRPEEEEMVAAVKLPSEVPGRVRVRSCAQAPTNISLLVAGVRDRRDARSQSPSDIPRELAPGSRLAACGTLGPPMFQRSRN